MGANNSSMSNNDAITYYGTRPTEEELANLETIMLFLEDEGYLLVRVIAQGKNGTACLVRSVKDSKLYVRKEDIVCSDASNVVPSDFTNVRALQDMPGVARLHSWFKHEQKQIGAKDAHYFYVSYWELCNAGDLHYYYQKYMVETIIFPERIAIKWLYTMLTTILKLHRRGIAHHDRHLGNWFVHRESESTDPIVVLGDFGLSVAKLPGTSDNDVSLMMREDLVGKDAELICNAGIALVSLNSESELCFSLKSMLENLEGALYEYNASELDEHIERVAEQAAIYLKDRPQTGEDLVKIGNDRGADSTADLKGSDFKTWRLAKVRNENGPNIEIVASKVPQRQLDCESRVVAQG